MSGSLRTPGAGKIGQSVREQTTSSSVPACTVRHQDR